MYFPFFLPSTCYNIYTAVRRGAIDRHLRGRFMGGRTWIVGRTAIYCATYEIVQSSQLSYLTACHRVHALALPWDSIDVLCTAPVL